MQLIKKTIYYYETPPAPNKTLNVMESISLILLCSEVQMLNFRLDSIKELIFTGASVSIGVLLVAPE